MPRSESITSLNTILGKIKYPKRLKLNYISYQFRENLSGCAPDLAIIIPFKTNGDIIPSLPITNWKKNCQLMILILNQLQKTVHSRRVKIKPKSNINCMDQIT